MESDELPMAEPSNLEKFAFHCEALTLWRDGHQAVVSAKIGGRWVRLIETDCRGMFHNELAGKAIRELSRTDFMARRGRRNNEKNPASSIRLREDEELWNEVL